MQKNTQATATIRALRPETEVCMGFVKSSEWNSFCGVDWDTRGEILCRYLKYGESLRSIGEDIFNGEGTQASQRPSQVSRAFGFSGRDQAGKYRHVPEAAFYDFAAELKPENTGSGLNAGTFDRWLKEWYARQEEANCGAGDNYEEDEPHNKKLRKVQDEMFEELYNDNRA